MRNWINRVLNLTLYLCICLMIGTGLTLAFRLPPGSQGGRGQLVASLRRHEWGDIHEMIGYAFIVLVLTHLFLHWNWLIRIAQAMALRSGFGWVSVLDFSS